MWYVHVNRGTIDSNRKHGAEDAPIAVRRGKYGRSSYGRNVSVSGAINIRYDPAGILPCGAKVVIECKEEPKIIE